MFSEMIFSVAFQCATRISDPARFSFAHGGKDGHPFPVPRKVYDESIAVLRSSLDAAKLGDKEKLEGFRLEQFTRSIETGYQPEADFQAVIAHEKKISSSLDGRTVFDDQKKKMPRSLAKQLPLF
jgi:hypothetical protein